MKGRTAHRKRRDGGGGREKRGRDLHKQERRRGKGEKEKGYYEPRPFQDHRNEGGKNHLSSPGLRAPNPSVPPTEMLASSPPAEPTHRRSEDPIQWRGGDSSRIGHRGGSPFRKNALSTSTFKGIQFEALSSVPHHAMAAGAGLRVPHRCEGRGVVVLGRSALGRKRKVHTSW